MTTISYAPRMTLVYCPECGWNVKGTARLLRNRNLRYFGATFLLIPLALPIFAIFHRLDPILGYLLDVFFILMLFIPALIRSRRNQQVAFQLDRLQPRRPLRPKTDWSPEPELAIPVPRPVHGSGNLAPIALMMALVRLLAGVVMAALLFSLPPIAAFMGGATQFVALLVLVATIPPFLGLLAFLVVLTRRQRLIVANGTPIRGDVDRQETFMRRLAEKEAWTLDTRYRYVFEDSQGRSYSGTAREEGRAIAEGDALTVLILPDDPTSHLSYLGSLYRAGEAPAS
ncbi:hypothetical protein D3C87_908520 [compost metagenome]